MSREKKIVAGKDSLKDFSVEKCGSNYDMSWKRTDVGKAYED